MIFPRTFRRAALCAALLRTCASLLPAQDDAAAARHAGIEAMYPVMMKAVASGDFAQARMLCEHAILMEPQNPVHRYNLACIEARAGGPMLRRAVAALEQAVQLGYNDLESLRTDPDLAAIRDDPKFAALVAKVSAKAAPAGSTGMDAARTETPRTADKKTAPAQPAAAAPTVAAKPASKSAAVASATVEQPAPAKFRDGVPVGLYFMTRFWMASRSLEKVVWYFAPDGTVYHNLTTGFSAQDLASHRGRKGKAALDGEKLVVTWSDGTKTTSRLERDATGFGWDMGLFGPVKPIGSAQEIAGRYEGGESIAVSGGRAAVAKSLELHADGTFRSEGAASVTSTSDASRVTAGSSGAGASGTWRAAGYSLVFTDEAGNTRRQIAFPYDDEKTPLKPDRLFIGGIMFNKRP